LVLELLALLMTAGSGAGVLVTLLVWARLDARRHAHLVAQLSRQKLLPAVVLEDAPQLRVRFVDGDRAVELVMDQRGASTLWRVAVSCPRWTELAAAQLVEERWARGTPGLHALEHHTLDLRHVFCAAWVLGDVLEDAVRFVDARLPPHLVGRLLADCGLRCLRLGPGQVELLLDRDKTGVMDVLCAVSAALDVADVLDGKDAGRRVMRPEGPRHMLASSAGQPFGYAWPR
jgi:hypothetical protein